MISSRGDFESGVALVRLLFESGDYSRATSIRSYTVFIIIASESMQQEDNLPSSNRFAVDEDVKITSLFTMGYSEKYSQSNLSASAHPFIE